MIKKILSVLVVCFTITHIEAQTANSLGINDTRGLNDLPNFSSRSLRVDFKQRSIVGAPGDGAWSTNISLLPWADNDNTGDKNHQLNFNKGGIFYRNAFPTDLQWGGWKQLLLLNESGNLGIGTANPSSYEHGGNNKVLEISNLNTTINSQLHVILSSGANVPNSSIGSITWTLPNSTSNYKGVAYLGVISDDTSTIFKPSSTMIFSTRSTANDFWSERMRINSFGNVGIGTTNPTIN